VPCEFLTVSFSTGRKILWCETLCFHDSVPEDSVFCDMFFRGIRVL
jgi:hypothetical protein